jgi:hypothetical protein
LCWAVNTLAACTKLMYRFPLPININANKILITHFLDIIII